MQQFEVVRIEPHPTNPKRCTIGFRSPYSVDTAEVAQRYARDLGDGDARQGVNKDAIYVVVGAGGDPLRDPECLVLFSHPGTSLALPY